MQRQDFTEFKETAERVQALRKKIFAASLERKFDEANELLTDAAIPAEHRILLLEMLYAAYLNKDLARITQLADLTTTNKELAMLIHAETISEANQDQKESLINTTLDNLDDLQGLMDEEIRVILYNRFVKMPDKERRFSLIELMCDLLDKDNFVLADYVLQHIAKPNEKLYTLEIIANGYARGGYQRQADLVMQFAEDPAARLAILKGQISAAVSGKHPENVTFITNQALDMNERYILLYHAAISYIDEKDDRSANTFFEKIKNEKLTDIRHLVSPAHVKKDRPELSLEIPGRLPLSHAASAPPPRPPAKFSTTDEKVYAATLSPQTLSQTPKKLSTLEELSSFLNRISGINEETKENIPITHKRIENALNAVRLSDITKDNLILFLKCYYQRDSSWTQGMFAKNKRDTTLKVLDFFNDRSIRLDSANLKILMVEKKLLTKIINKFASLPEVMSFKQLLTDSTPKTPQSILKRLTTGS